MQELTRTAQMYDVMAPDWMSHGEPLTSAFAAPMLDLCLVGSDTKLLDAGAGTGALAIAAAQRGADVLAVDIAPAMVARMAERLVPFPRARARVMDAQSLALDDGIFDAATSLFGVTCADDWHASLSELVRVVRPGGVVVISHWVHPAGPGPMRLMIEAVHRLRTSPAATLTADIKVHTRETLTRDLHEVGLEDRRGKGTPYRGDRHRTGTPAPIV